MNHHHTGHTKPEGRLADLVVEEDHPCGKAQGAPHQPQTQQDFFRDAPTPGFGIKFIRASEQQLRHIE